MKQIQINTTTNSGWVITSHYEFDEKNNKMKSKRLDECWVYLSYAIGEKEPLQATASDGEKIWDISEKYVVYPNEIIEYLELKKPIYYETSEWGAYGNGFKWDLL